MELSVAGILVCCALLMVGLLLRSPIIVALFASIPFGATAFITFGFDGPSPLIYTLFAMLLLVSVATRPRFLHDIGLLFSNHWVPWVVVFLTIYAGAGAIILPRLLIGETTVFVHAWERVTELPLAPVSGNITQVAYFALGAMVFFAFYLVTQKSSGFDAVRKGFIVYAVVQVVLGILDLGGKILGLGDVLEPIRTASYSMLTLVEVAGFWRIAGGCAEASTFADMSVPCLAFVFVYWRATGSKIAMLLALALFGFLLFSTSSTAYVALAVLAVVLAVSLPQSMIANRLLPRDLMILAFAIVGLSLLTAVYLTNEKILDPFFELFNMLVFEKLSSGSGVARAYQNTKSLQSLIDTHGLGVGMGSSRSSSWIISVLAQLGIIGAAMMGSLVAFLLYGMTGLERPKDQEEFNITISARAAGLASLLTASISGGHADPGLVFFISLAVLLSCRKKTRQSMKQMETHIARGDLSYSNLAKSRGMSAYRPSKAF